MGCCEFQAKSATLAESIIAKAEKKLGISSLNVETTDYELSVLNSSGKIYQNQLEQLFRILKLDSKLILQVLSFFPFKQEGNYAFQSEKRLRALFILLGRGQKDQKLKLLYKLYASESKSSISVEELTRMIEDLLLISLVCIPEFALSIYGDKFNITSMVYILISSMQRLLADCLKKIGFLREIRCSSVISLFRTDRVGMLLEPNRLRSFALFSYEQTFKYIGNGAFNKAESAMKEPAVNETKNKPPIV
jgi:hypothetical protein